MYSKLIASKILIITFISLVLGCASSKPEKALKSYLNLERKVFPEFDFNKDENVENSNIYNIDKLFDDMSLPENESEDYYFVVLGDSRNLIRSDDLSGFDHVAKHIIYAKDKNKEKYIYDKIKFIVHLGDIVYEGAVEHQWDNLKKAFSKKDYFGDNYPYIKLLVKDKPFFPVLGNHEIMKFRLKRETPYMNHASSNKGLNLFKEFFSWDKFISNPNILYAIPGELTKDNFSQLCEKLETKDVQKLEKHYVLLSDNSFHLKIFQDFINEYKNKEGLIKAKNTILDPIKKSKVIKDLQPIFNKLGYNTLPVLTSDNMICYAFEINNIIYLVLDSMTRGWQYNTFSELKKSVYHQKNKQHYLNLFTKSDLNGQYEFFKAVSDYAKSNGKKIVPFMHHSPISSGQKIDGNGIEYNLKLMLGVEYQKEKDTFIFDENIDNHTFFDDIIFFNLNDSENSDCLNNVFTSCVHYYEKFSLELSKDNQVKNKLDWYITGGGGGELSTDYDYNKIHYTEMLFNERLKNTYKGGNTALSNPSIQIKNNNVKKSYNFLIVHVKGNKIIDVFPSFIDEKEVKLERPLIKLSASTINPVFSSPFSTGQSVNLRLWSWGLEKLSPVLQTVTWEPSIGIGFLNYNMKGDNEIVSLEQGDALRFTLHFSNHREVTLSLLEITRLTGGGNHFRGYLSFGLEGPILYNIFSNYREPIPTIMKKFSMGAKYHISTIITKEDDPDFGKDIKYSYFFKFTLF